MQDSMRHLTILFLCVHTLALGQIEVDMNVVFEEVRPRDTIFASTEPVEGYAVFIEKLESMLSGPDTIGRKYDIHLDNIAFVVGEDGVIDSAWVIFYKRPLFFEIIKQLKTTKWQPAVSSNGVTASHQELNLTISLTRRTLKKHHCWPSFAEQVLPWVH